MKKTIGTMAVAALVVLLTATFGFAEFAATGGGDFPYFQMGCLIMSELLIISKREDVCR